MSKDHPDGVLPISHSRADIKVPMDIQKQTLSQLDIKIVAAEATVTLNVAVSGTAQVNLYAQSIGLYLKADWEVKEGNAKWFRILSYSASDFGESNSGNYTVPTGKTLYINYVAALSKCGFVADAEEQNPVAVYFDVDSATKFALGGLIGCGMSFVVPFKVTAGQVFLYSIRNLADHQTYLTLTVGGYEE